MATTSSREAQIQKRVRETLKSLEQPVDFAETLAELRREVKMYEERYGLPSEKIHDAIDSGELVEDLDVVHWIFTYEIVSRAETD